MREFMDFIVHEKAWWMTPIVVVLLAMVAFILWAEASPVLPFIYTVFWRASRSSGAETPTAAG
ncbi:MAG: hypothetical protein IPN01_07010 [Deltaproteobacteria bacterium]|nr:hypothetical protein [Deltaproteobacteria bacterium]